MRLTPARLPPCSCVGPAPQLLAGGFRCAEAALSAAARLPLAQRSQLRSEACAPLMGYVVHCCLEAAGRQAQAGPQGGRRWDGMAVHLGTGVLVVA